MMSKVVSSAVAVVTTFSFAIAPVLHVQAQELPPVVTAYSSITVKVDNAKIKDLFNFTTDLHQDHLWFPDVAETIQLTSGDKKGVGEEYIQRSYFAGFPLDTHITVTGHHPYKYHSSVGVGMFASYDAFYYFEPDNGSNGGKFTLVTRFTAPGISEDNLVPLLTLAMQNVLNHFNSTGEITLDYIYIQ